MTENMKHCKYLLPVQYVIDGGTTVMPNQWTCRLKQIVYGEVYKCQQTPFEGPCYQYLSMPPKEWNEFVKARLQESEGG